MNKKVVILLFIFIVASFFRLWRLGEVPISPDWDEVSLGYNAYSILHTGRDEFGKFLPFVLRSFNDYKPALYAYLTIPSIAIFDLNVFAVRLPSAFFGILTVIATYFLVEELFKGSKLKLKICEFEFGIPEITTLLLAISPWHLQFSRVAFESNVGLAFNIFGVLFFLKGLKSPKLLLISSFFMGLNLYTYQSEKVFTPLLLLVLLISFRKRLFSLSRRYLFYSVILGVVISLPMAFFIMTNKEALVRAQGVSIFSNRTELLSNSIQKIKQDKETNDYLGILLDNRRIIYGKKMIENYFSHYDLNWLFINGDTKIYRHHAPNMGLLYLWELPFLFVGIYVLIFGFKADGFDGQAKALIFLWFLIAPIPASITNGVPHAVRTLNFLPIFQIFIAIGFIYVLLFILNIKYKIFYIKVCYLFIILYSSIIVLNVAYYFNQYFVQQNYFFALDWQYGYKEVIDYIKPIQHNYKKIIVSDSQDMSQSYMFFLFFLKYDPKKYLSEGGTLDGNKFSNFEFRSLDYYKEDKNVLLVGTIGDFPEVSKTIKEVKYPDKSVAIKIVEKN